MSHTGATSMDAGGLRLAFDSSFAESQSVFAAPTENFLDVRIDADSYAIRLSETAGLFANRVVTAVPSRLSAFVGATTFRGGIVPVYDLAVLLGYAATGSSRWLVVTAATPVALLLRAFASHLRLPRDAAGPAADRLATRSYVREVVPTPLGLRPVVHLPSVLEAVRELAKPIAAGME
jgi:chemotaxis signal transduction protein